MAKYVQGKFKPINPHKYEGNPMNIIFRSSWELKFLRWCDSNQSIIKYSSEEIVVPYLCPTDNRWHRYFPDAKIVIKDKLGNIITYLVEIKPFAQTKPPVIPKKKTKRYINEVMTWGKNEAKWKFCDKYAKERGWQFMVITEHDLYGK
jgi:hypothetical protein